MFEGTLDSYVLPVVTGGLFNLAVFFVGHLGLNRIRGGRPWNYAFLGALTALCTQSILITPGGWSRLLERGNASLFVFVVGIAGAVLGYIYFWKAGYEPETDESIQAFEKVSVGAAQYSNAGALPNAITPDEVGLVAAGREEFFDGPTQVRTSLPIMFVASLISTGFFAGAQCLAVLAAGSFQDALSTKTFDLFTALSTRYQEGLLPVMFIPLEIIPFTLLLLASHSILKAMKKTSYAAYLLTGILTPLLVSLLAGFQGLFLGLYAIIPMGIAACAYRNMAGIEPVPVKEDVIVTDRRSLVGSAHPRRRFSRVIPR